MYKNILFIDVDYNNKRINYMDKEVGNKLDLILNVNIPFEDNFNIEHEYY